MAEDRMLSDEILLGLIKANSGGGGGGGTDDYNDLKNQPKIENVTLKGNKSLSDLGIASAAALADKVDKVQGKGLSTNDFTDAYKTAIGDNTTAINDIKNGEEINSFGGVETALSDVSDDVGSLKSGFTNLDNEVNGDATVYPYADVITIPDAVPSNLADCNVKIEPVQDLHGQSSPYVGGAGKNKFDSSVLGDVSNNMKHVTLTLKPNTIYTMSTSQPAVSETANIFFHLEGESESTAINGVHSRTDRTLTTGADGVVVVAYRLGTWTVSEYTSFNYQIEEGSTATDYAPFENICPISGHTEVDVQMDGKNLCDKGEGNVYNGGKLIPVSAGDKIYCYGEWVSDNKSFYGAIFSTPTETSKGNKIAILDDFYTGVSKEMTISTNGYFGVCFDTSVESYTVSKMMISKTPIASATDYEPYSGKTYTIALGSTIYGGTVDFDSGVMTVTKAIVDLGDFTWTVGDNGRVTATAAISGAVNPAYNRFKAQMVSDRYKVLPYYVNEQPGVDAQGTDGSFAIRVSSSGTTVNYPFVHDSNLIGMSAAEVNTALTGAKILYELATPFTVQLTHKQIQLLKGVNTLTASTGQISVTANGVSGAIGAVQEQVNELAEDVAEIEPVNYSTTEQKTGQKWIDGNDIYFKAIDIGALPNATNKDVLTNITNIRDVVKIDGIATNGTIYTGIPHGANIAQYGVEVSYDKTNNYVRVSTSEDQSSYTGVIVIYYTKTA